MICVNDRRRCFGNYSILTTIYNSQVDGVYREDKVSKSSLGKILSNYKVVLDWIWFDLV